ncbi:hypothetical protein AT6N2_C3380 [Agrobacterium tumefaciens]|nr:hypothetical protein AT6N2_C3380 [Agrobacterium tumefaciens]
MSKSSALMVFITLFLLVSGTPDGNDPQPVISIGVDRAPALASQLRDHNIPLFRCGFERNDKSFLVQPKRPCFGEIYSMLVFVTFTFGRV